jgi:hypothetical protein
MIAFFSKFNRRAILSFLLLGFTACTKDGYDSLKEKADIEAAQAQDQANKNLIERAQIMEADLARRQRFYQGVAGQYEGVFSSADATGSIRMTFMPTVFPYKSERVRQPEEVAKDLNDLGLDVHIVQWSHRYPENGWGCRAEAVKGDLEKGLIHIVVDEGCSFTFSFGIVDSSVDMRELTLRQQVEKVLSLLSPLVAQDLLSGRTSEVTEIAGVIRPSNSPNQFYFRAPKK